MPTVLVPPAEFGAIPFGVTIYDDGSTDFDPTTYRLIEGAPGVTTYYVDKATGIDTNPGTAALPFRTLNKVCRIPRATAPTILCRVKGGTYYLPENFGATIPNATSLSVVPWDDQPVICSHENPNIMPASWTDEGDDTYSASVAGYGYSRNRSSVWDGQTRDAWGDYLPLVPVASIALVKTTPNTYYTELATSRVYVHCIDGRTPDTDIHVFEAYGAPGQFKNYPSAPADSTCYFDGITFMGGARSFALMQGDAVHTTTAVFNGCSFRYGGVAVPASLQLDGNVDVALVKSVVSASHKDGFSYHSYGSNPAPRSIEIDCEARRCGSILTGTANQGTTMHDGGRIVRVNGNYHHNENDQVADVGQGTKAWLVRCLAADGLKPGYAGFLSGNGNGKTAMWLYGCSVSNCTRSYTVGDGSTLCVCG